MSEITEVLNTGQQAHFDRDISKIFIWGNENKEGVYTNTTGNEVTLLAGTVMGRVTGSGEWLPTDSTSADGSEVARAVLMSDYVVADTVSQTIALVDSGHVAEEKLVLVNGGDTLDTAVGGELIRDTLESKSVSIKLIKSVELTGFDNQ